MRLTISNADEIGAIVRAVRKHGGLRQDDAAGLLSVGETFMLRLENGETSLQWDKLLKVLQGLGIRVELDVPDITEAALEKERLRLQERHRRRNRRPA
ncbi:helix-turn-helix domain-containing protein [Cupriavidus agavae]|uniref:Helix-turn-helix protein n=1 Tax=Cupriavidus agavae TaxID=1001822 RepID=A0A4Q7R8B7_9BURK|nr:helix-turn-helix domain-containing protein [Cupriavidus agavae]RZT29046.1 helix-turn-helix protein [Cupriavidus agavae]